MKEKTMKSDGSNLKNMKVLVVDDTPENLQVLYKTLKNEGYEISLVRSGEEALNLVSSFSPDLILLDIIMPGIDGYEVCRRIKNNKKTQDISVIFLSAKMDSEDIVKGFEVGAVDYITKPFEQAEVLARVKNHLMLQWLHKDNVRYISELERSNKELDSFAHVVSHDLKQPLRKIIAFGDILIENAVDLLPENKEYLEKMGKAAFDMKDFIDDLLKFSALKKVESNYPLTDLTKIIDDVLNDFNTRILESGATINIAELPTLEAVPHQMHQLFQNLFSNSLKYQKKGIPPVIKLSSFFNDNGLWEINITDNGIGFDNKYAKKIFKLFERLHSRSDYEGTGIGLAICEKITKLHYGTIEVKSVKGEGTTFTIFLPQKQPIQN
jgi:two-component system, sensor histidine kinase and response regulator